MRKEIEIELPPALREDAGAIQKAAAKKLGVSEAEINSAVVQKRSIDARSKNAFYRLRLQVYLGEEAPSQTYQPAYKNVKSAERVLILGAGPAGLFAALRLIEHGLKPVVLDRGKEVRTRRRDLALINKEGIINTDSNYCFGEGGAGTYSDGKLYTRSGKKEEILEVLRLFRYYGAPESILTDARPHIGTNKLPAIITAIREQILECGGEVHFDTKVTDLKLNLHEIKAVTTADGAVWDTKRLILSGGHSARDLFYLLRQRDVQIEAKPFALGLRIEHSQELVNSIQYHSRSPDPELPPAYYQLVEQVDERGVFSFCMCPGGIIAPCATGKNEIVVNGWSPSKRNNPFANSGMVVQVNMEDIPGADRNPLAALHFQEKIEARAFEAGGGMLRAPAQRMIDFVKKINSADLPDNSYIPGTTSADLGGVLPEFIASRLRKALPQFDKKMKGYYTNEAILVGVESRTSSPVRIPRLPETLQHPFVKGLYPCGEGAGYAGGIMSAAIDGRLVADAIAAEF